MGGLRKLRRQQKPTDLGRVGVHAHLFSNKAVQRFIEQVAGKPPTKNEILAARAQINHLDAELRMPNNSIPRLRRLWDKFARKGGARIVNRLMLEKEIEKISTLGNIKPSDAIASIGSGPATSEAFVAKNLAPNGTVTCFDTSPEMSKLALQTKEKAQASNMSIFTRSGTMTGLPASSQDKVFAMRTFLTDTIHWQPLLIEVKRIIKKAPNARFIVTFEAKNDAHLKQIKESIEQNGFQPLHVLKYAVFGDLSAVIIIAKPALVE